MIEGTTFNCLHTSGGIALYYLLFARDAIGPIWFLQTGVTVLHAGPTGSSCGGNAHAASVAPQRLLK